MIVLHVLTRLNVGGTARYVGELVKNIPNSRLAIGHVQFGEIEDASAREISVIRIPHLGRKISIFNDIRAYFELCKVIRNLQPQIVHTHTFKAGLIGRLAPGQHKRVHTFHGHLFDDFSLSWAKRITINFSEYLLSKRTDFFVSVGERVAEDVRKRRIGKNKCWKSIPPGIQPLTTINKNIARQLLGLEDNSFLVGWMARMTEVKNPLKLVKIAECLPSINFVMGGGGNLLEIVSTKAPPNLKVLGWVDASVFWSAVDLGISTSNNAGMPISLIEAQWSGIPVVSTDAGSCAEVVENRVTGIISPKEVHALSAAVQLLANNPDLRIEMGKKAKSHALKKFSLDSMVRAHAEIYSQL